MGFAAAMNPLVEKPIHVNAGSIDDGFLKIPSFHGGELVSLQVQGDGSFEILIAQNMLQHS